MAKRPNNPLRDYLSELAEEQRSLVVLSLSLQIDLLQPKTEDEKRDRLEAVILKGIN